LLGIRIGTPLLSDVAGNAGQGTGGSVHYLVDAWGWGVEPGEVSHRQLDAVQNVRQRGEFAQLGQTAERLHPPDPVVQRVAIPRGSAKGARRAIQGARDERALARYKGPDTRVQLGLLGLSLGE